MSNYSGFGEREFRREKQIPFNKLPGEHVLYNNSGDAIIVLGHDRTAADIVSGYGGLGDIDSTAVDIVCGRARTRPKEERIGASSVNPDFFSDAARIYVSEKTDVDHNFRLAKGSIGRIKSASAIALKADGVRIIGVEGVKIITRANSTNSNNKEPGVKGIELIAGNDDTFLQPMVKGDNLVECLRDMMEQISNVEAEVHSVMNTFSDFLNSYQFHIHGAAGASPPPDASLAFATFNADFAKHCTRDEVINRRLSKIEEIYLIKPDHAVNILSPYNKTN
jgi:hypothetical protein